MKRMLVHLLLCFPCLAFSQVPVADQVPNSVSGRIVDSSGEPLQSVEVTLEQSNGWSKTSHTDRDGMYHFDCLTKGTYSAKFKLTGFITERMEDFTIWNSYTLELDRTLQIDPAYHDIFIFPSDEPSKGLIINVKNNQSSDYLEKAIVLISNADGLVKRLPATDACGNTGTFLETKGVYSVRVSKDGFQGQVINLNMAEKPERIEVRLNPK